MHSQRGVCTCIACIFSCVHAKYLGDLRQKFVSRNEMKVGGDDRRLAHVGMDMRVRVECTLRKRRKGEMRQYQRKKAQLQRDGSIILPAGFLSAEITFSVRIKAKK